MAASEPWEARSSSAPTDELRAFAPSWDAMTKTHDLVLHTHPFAAFCWKPLIALHELGLPFTAHVVDGDEGRRELAEVWAMASIPVLRDETAGLTLPSSTSIVEHLDALAWPDGGLIPADHEPALQARLWDRLVDDHVAVPMQAIVANSLKPAERRDPAAVLAARETLDRAYGVLRAQLRGHEWLAGDTFTVADCAAAPALFYARAVHTWDEDERPELTRYYRALMHRPSVRRVVDDARPYRNLFPLPLPEDVDAHQPVG